MRSTPFRAAGCFFAALLLLAGSASDSYAFQPTHDHATYDIPLQEFDLHGYRNPATGAGREAAVTAVTERYGGVWDVYSWNPQTGTPHALTGSGVKLSAPFGTAAEIEATARQVIAANHEVFKADVADLRLLEMPVGLGKRAVRFQQTYAGLDVWGARVTLTFTEEGRLFALGSDYYSDIDLDPRPALDAAQAEAIARGDLPFDPATDSIEDGTMLLVLPEPLSPTAVAHHLVWRVRVHTDQPLGIWVTHVDAHTGEIVWRYNDVHFADASGHVDIHTERVSWCDGVITAPGAHFLLDGPGVDNPQCDSNGDWLLSEMGSEPFDMTFRFYGPYCRVLVYAESESEIVESITPGTPHEFVFNDRNSRADERDVFDSVSQIHDFFQLFAPGFGLPNTRMTANVNIDDVCNAYWNGNINFFRAGGTCANTGQIQSVITHEYGHGVQNAILGWQGDQGLGEGNSDILANLITQEAEMGRGFYTNQCDVGIRSSENALIYPDDVIGIQIHSAGRVIAGFHWDLMIRLQELYGDEAGTIEAASLWHYGRVLEDPWTQPDQVLATFIADDDDGNLDNGTPHYELICEAASNHNFDCPTISEGVFIAHTVPVSFTTPQDVELRATITSSEGNLDPDSLLACYRVNGGAFQNLVLTPSGTPDEYVGTISGLALPSEVEYYIRGVDFSGNATNYPSLAPLRLCSVDYAWNYDAFESESGWTVDLEGSDDATSGTWERVDPIGTVAAPEDDFTPGPYGTQCWVTGQGTPGGVAGEADVDGGTTSLYSPVYNLSGAPLAEVKYARWFSNNLGGDKHADNWVVQVRNNGGDWIDIENAEDEQNTWTQREADLLAVIGEPLGEVQLRFLASDLGDGTLLEAALDEFILRALIDASAAPDGFAGQPRLALFGSRTNPISGPTEIAFELPAPSAVRLSVFDVTGRSIRALAGETFSAGRHAVEWDGRDDRGQAAATGVYYVRMQTPGFDASQKVIVQR